MLEKAIHLLNEIVWNPALVVLLLLAGLFFTLKTRCVQVRRFRLMFHSLFGKRPEGESGISSFQAFCIALSGRVGTGNIVGVATAIAFGGPGAVFWMWIVAFLGASTAFVESTLSQMYKFQYRSGFRGGPFSFIEKGLGKKWLGVLFAVITAISCGLFLTTVQANGVATAMENAFPVSPLETGLVLALILGIVIIGGEKRIARVASVITPFMAISYIIMSLVVIGVNIREVPGTLALIVKGAFGVNQFAGGIIGSTIAMGVKRGIFSNEAGQGTGAIVSAAASVDHPARQGLAQAFSVYVDTLLVCTATALMILTTGNYNVIDPSTGEMLMENVPSLGNNYVGYTQGSVNSIFPGFGDKFISIAMIFFAFTTIMAYYFYSESGIIYLLRGKSMRKNKVYIITFQVLMLGAVIFGSVHEADLVWQLGDIGVGLMAWGTLVSILILFPKAISALKDFEKDH